MASPRRVHPGAGGGPERRRQLTQEFKLEAVRLVAQGDRRASEVACELGIRPDMPRQWRRQAEGLAGRGAVDVLPGNGKLTSHDEEIRRMQRENARFQEERDILGRATAFFAKYTR